MSTPTPAHTTPTWDGERMTDERLVWLEAQRDGGEVPDDSDVLEWLTEVLLALRAERDAPR